MNAEFHPEKERLFLNSLTVEYRDQSPYSKIKKDIIAEEIFRLCRTPGEMDALELGCANGYETQLLASMFRSVTVVDGSTRFLEKAQLENKNQGTKFIYSLFEEFRNPEHGRLYDVIVCNYVLEHVYDPVVVLKNLKTLLKPSSLLFVVVPNSEALSRQIALAMGLIKNLTDLTENDHRHGHRRVYNRESILRDMQDSGLKVQSSRGLVLKILADFQLNDLLSQNKLGVEHIKAMDRVAGMSPEHGRFADSFLVVASS